MSRRGRGRRAASARAQGRGEENEMYRAIQDVANTLANAIREALHPQRSDNRMRSALREVQRHNPPTFSGEPDPTVAEDWLLRVERLFDLLEIEPEFRVRIATNLLIGDALQWWIAVERLREEEKEKLTWQEFSTAFLDKYFPAVARYQREEEFPVLKQGSMTVQQYEARFTALTRYATELVANDAVKAKKFQAGLRDEIRFPVAVQRLGTYVEVVETAMVVEQQFRQTRRLGGSGMPSRGFKRGEPSSKRQKTPFGSSSFFSTQSPRTTFMGERVCHRCGQPGHLQKDCFQCFGCGQYGHVVRNCPTWRSNVSNIGDQAQSVYQQGPEPIMRPPQMLMRRSPSPSQQSSQGSQASPSQACRPQRPAQRGGRREKMTQGWVFTLGQSFGPASHDVVEGNQGWGSRSDDDVPPELT